MTDTFVLLRQWKDYAATAGRLSDKTQQQYMRSMLTFLSITLKSVEDTTPKDVQRVLSETATRGGYRDQMLKAAMSFFRWHAKRYHTDDPTEDFAIRKRRAGPPDYLTREDLERLFVAAEQVDPRARPTLELMYGTAARIRSITELRPEDIDVEHRAVRFILGVKNDAAYALPLGPRAYAAALRLLELKDYVPKYGQRRDGKLVGVSEERVRQWMRDAGARAGLTQRMYPHLLRHSALTHLSWDPANTPNTLMMIANWQDLSPSRRYLAANAKDISHAVSRL